MAEKSSDKKHQSGVSKIKKRPSTSKTVGPKEAELRLQAKPASAPTKLTDDLWAKEEQYKLMNAELEAKTADLVRQAEQLVREQNEVLSKPLPDILLSDIEDDDDSRTSKYQPSTVQDSDVKVMSKKKVTLTAQSLYGRKQGKKPRCQTLTSNESSEAHVEDAADLFLAKTIQNMEEKMSEAGACENVVTDVCPGEDNIGSDILDAQTRVLRAKLRILQEELDQLSHEYYMKDDENAKLSAKIKNIEEDRAKLQKTTSLQQAQIEKHNALAEESSKKCDGLQLQVSALNKEIEHLNRTQKQAAAVHSTVVVRLNRALEEMAKLKTELKNTKQMTKDKISEVHESEENLLAENKMLKKQKAELIVGFKKQLKLISILKRAKMHSEVGKQLSLTEEEFVKALDLGKS